MWAGYVQAVQGVPCKNGMKSPISEVTRAPSAEGLITYTSKQHSSSSPVVVLIVLVADMPPVYLVRNSHHLFVYLFVYFQKSRLSLLR